jgi:hypothetical protein
MSAPATPIEAAANALFHFIVTGDLERRQP